jgi:large subunit ribosomal protein L10
MKRVGQVYRDTLVNRIKDSVDKKNNTFLLSYTKLSGPQLNDLRKTLKKVGADVCVSKNAIAQIALKNLKHDRLADRVNGQTAFVWSDADSVEISKILIKFAKDIENIKLQGGLLEGKILEKDDVKKLSELPSKQVLLAMLLGTLQSPLTRLAGALNAKNRELLSILKQLSEKKGGT